MADRQTNGPARPGQNTDHPTTPNDAVAPATEAAAPPPQLTPEEQMALYEESLKEEDWGHQPC